MWDQTYGCAKQYRCSIDYYVISFLSKSHQTVLNIADDTPCLGKYVVHGFNAIQKQYIANCLIIHSTPELDKIDSKRMRFDTITDKG